MSDKFTSNLKLLLLYIVEYARRNSKPPLSPDFLKYLVEWYLSREDYVQEMKKLYTSSRDIMGPERMYRYIKERDRDIFTHIDLFPEDFREQYGEYINWFSWFLREGIDDKYMEYVFRYLNAMNKHI